jgi:hypothetical protein
MNFKERTHLKDQTWLLLEKMTLEPDDSFSMTRFYKLATLYTSLCKALEKEQPVVIPNKEIKL